jgi:chromosome segregation ATPase
MTEHQETVQVNEGSPRWLGVAIVALAVVSLIALGIGWSASTHVREAQQAATNDNQVLRKNLDVLGQRLSQTESVNAQLQGDLSVVTDRLKLTQGELDRARRQTTKISQDYSKQLADVQDSVKSDENQLATKANADDVNGVKTDVNGVRTDLDSTKQGLLDARNELGTQIAHNHDELDQLRRLGQRDYFEFTVANKGAKQKLGDITLELRNTNLKHNQYTVDLYVDDMKLEKKNRSVNEPIFFYTRGTRAAMELVVNQVGKDKIVGYLSVPKVQSAQAISSTPGN